jgi:ketosteroid isomerase-like protein
MNRRLLVFLVALALTTIAAGPAFSQAPAAGNRAAVEKQVLAAERAINEAFAKGDTKTFHANLTPDAVSIDSAGIMKVNADFDKMMLAVKVQSWNLDSSQFYWVNDNTIIHMYRWTGKGTYQGQPVPSPTWASTVWTNKGGKWTAAFHQESVAMPAPPPAPAAGKK